MAFQKFVETGRSFRPKVTIRRTGSLGFTIAAIKKFDINEYPYAVLYYDSEGQKIGIKPTAEPEDGAVKINRARQSTWISAKRFFDFYEIPIKNGRYDAILDSKEGMIIIEIKGGDSAEKKK